MSHFRTFLIVLFIVISTQAAFAQINIVNFDFGAVRIVCTDGYAYEQPVTLCPRPGWGPSQNFNASSGFGWILGTVLACIRPGPDWERWSWSHRSEHCLLPTLFRRPTLQSGSRLAGLRLLCRTEGFRLYDWRLYSQFLSRRPVLQLAERCSAGRWQRRHRHLGCGGRHAVYARDDNVHGDLRRRSYHPVHGTKSW